MKKANSNPSERNRTVHQESAVALEKFRRPLLVYLTSGLDHSDKWVRYMAADIIGTVGDPTAIGNLMPLLVSEDMDLRAISLQSLEKIENFRTIPVHSGVAECNGCLIRSIAEEALEQLKNKSLCPSVT